METQERILFKAHELFMRLGIRSVSMDDIAQQLGMSKKTIYQFYADKDALVEDVIGIELKRSQEGCRQQNSISENAIQEIFLAMDMVNELLKNMNPSLMIELEKFHVKTYRKIMEHKNQFFYQVIKDNLEWGKKDELYREDISVELMTHFRLATMFLMFDTQRFPVGKFTASQILDGITENFLRGLATTKGTKLIQKYKQQRFKK